jgi:hypothetical protein
MTITFAPTMAPTVGYRLTDFLGGQSELIADYEAASAELTALTDSGEVLPGCTDPETARAYGATITVVTADGDDAPSANMSNANARILLDLLGLAGEDCGDCPADDFMGRVLVADALSPADEGVPVHDVASSPRVIECGRRPGYIQSQLDQLREVAAWSAAKGRDVQWA